MALSGHPPRYILFLCNESPLWVLMTRCFRNTPAWIPRRQFVSFGARCG
jgi:hypothetical protein